MVSPSVAVHNARKFPETGQCYAPPRGDIIQAIACWSVCKASMQQIVAGDGKKESVLQYHVLLTTWLFFVVPSAPSIVAVHFPHSEVCTVADPALAVVASSADDCSVWCC